MFGSARRTCMMLRTRRTCMMLRTAVGLFKSSMRQHAGSRALLGVHFIRICHIRGWHGGNPWRYKLSVCCRTGGLECREHVEVQVAFASVVAPSKFVKSALCMCCAASQQGGRVWRATRLDSAECPWLRKVVAMNLCTMILDVLLFINAMYVVLQAFAFDNVAMLNGRNAAQPAGMKKSHRVDVHRSV